MGILAICLYLTLARLDPQPPPDVSPSVEIESPTPEVHRPRPLTFSVQAWAIYRGRRHVYVHRIDIREVGRAGHGTGQIFGHTFAEESVRLTTAEPEREYSVVVTWEDGSVYGNHYRLAPGHDRTVTIYGPNW